VPFAAERWAWAQRLPPREKLILAYLAYRADESGAAWPHQSTVGEDCGLGDRQVRDVLKRLRDRGLIAVEHRYRPGGGRRSSVYRLVFDQNGPKTYGKPAENAPADQSGSCPPDWSGPDLFGGCG